MGKANMLVSMIAFGAKLFAFSNGALLTWVFIFVARLILISKGYDLLATIVIAVPLAFLFIFSLAVMFVSKEQKQKIFFGVFAVVNGVLLALALTE